MLLYIKIPMIEDNKRFPNVKASPEYLSAPKYLLIDELGLLSIPTLYDFQSKNPDINLLDDSNIRHNYINIMNSITDPTLLKYVLSRISYDSLTGDQRKWEYGAFYRAVEERNMDLVQHGMIIIRE